VPVLEPIANDPMQSFRAPLLAPCNLIAFQGNYPWAMGISRADRFPSTFPVRIGSRSSIRTWIARLFFHHKAEYVTYRVAHCDRLQPQLRNPGPERSFHPSLLVSST
jgi:hypothetical protein